jgi:hypothetical protein
VLEIQEYEKGEINAPLSLQAPALLQDHVQSYHYAVEFVIRPWDYNPIYTVFQLHSLILGLIQYPETCNGPRDLQFSTASTTKAKATYAS